MEKKTIFLVVDEIEGDLAVVILDDGPKFTLPLDSLPDGTRDGSVIRLDFTLDEEERRRREEEILSIQERLLRRTEERNK